MKGDVKMAKGSVLIVDDDKNICELLRLYIEKEGFSTSVAYDGEEALKLFFNGNFSIVVLDIMLPELDGWQVCRRIRAKSECPIIMLTAKGEIFDKVLGLELGADDYVVKPFEAKEVVARIKAVLRRTQDTHKLTDRKVEFDKLSINMDTFEMIVDGKVTDTPPKEMELIFYLASHPNRVFIK